MRWSRNATSSALTLAARATQSRSIAAFEMRGHRIRRGVAPQPELLDELLALFVRLQPLERRPFLVGDDVRHILVEPLAIGRFQLLAELLFLLLPFLIGHGPGNGFALRRAFLV